jgi:hypothetical protein
MFKKDPSAKAVPAVSLRFPLIYPNALLVHGTLHTTEIMQYLLHK